MECGESKANMMSPKLVACMFSDVGDLRAANIEDDTMRKQLSSAVQLISTLQLSLRTRWDEQQTPATRV